MAGSDMNYDEFKEVCCEPWSEKLNYLSIDMTKK